MPARLQPSFIQGEISPTLQGRVDADLYNQAAKTIKNWIILPTGGIENRAGTYYKGNPEDAEFRYKLFSYKSEAVYILIFGNLKMYVAKVDGDDIDLVMDGASPYELVTTYTTANLWKLDFTQTADTLYVTSEDYAVMLITRTSDTAWTITTGITGEYGPWRIPYTELTKTISPQTPTYYQGGSGENIILVESGASPYLLIAEAYIKVGHPSVIDETIIQWKTFDYVIPGGADYATYKMIEGPFGYAYNKNFSFLSNIQEWEDVSTGGASCDFSTDGQVIMNNGTGGTAILRQNNIPVQSDTNLIAFLNYGIEFPSGTPSYTVKVGTTPGASDIGSTANTYHLFKPSVDYVCISIEYSNTTNDKPLTVYDFCVTEREAAFNTKYWRVPVGNKADEYFKAVAIFNQRLVLAGSDDYPHRVDHSEVAKYDKFNFNTPYLANDAFNYEIDTKKAHIVKWLSQLNGLVLGTSDGIFRITAAQSNLIAPGDAITDLRTDIGCAQNPPLNVANNLLMVQKGGRDIYQIQDTNDRRYVETQLNFLSSHLFEGVTVKDWAYQANSYKMLWVVLSDGGLLGCTYIPDQQIFAWQQFETDGEVFTVEVAPGSDDDIVLFGIKREIDGGDKYYVEKLMPRITDKDTYDFFFVDCGIEYSSPGTATLTGLDHLEARDDVYAVCDGAVKGPYTVTSGEITIDADDYTIIKVGLKYNSDLETLDISKFAGTKKRVLDQRIRMLDTASLKAGKDADNLDLVFKKATGARGYPLPLVSGYKKANFNYQADEIATCYIRNDEPLPATILSIEPFYDNV